MEGKNIINEQMFTQEIAKAIQPVLIKFGIKNVCVIIPQEREIINVENNKKTIKINRPIEEMPVA